MITNTTEKLPENLLNVIDSLQHKLEENNLLLNKKDKRIESLEFRLQCALRQRFASRQEKFDDNDKQLNLFDEADLPDNKKEEAEEERSEETITVPAHTRTKRGRKPLPKDLPRIRREHDIPEADKTCPCGCQMHVIGEDISEQLEVIPAQMYVIEHAKKKYACKACSDTMRTAKAPTQAIPKSMAGPGLLAHILVSKFCDHLPLYRQEKILQRGDIDISRSTLCNWVIRCGQLVEPLIKLMIADINEYDIAYADETPVQILKEPGRRAQQKSYMWLFGGGKPSQFAWVYQYHPGRHGSIPQTFFEDFKGYLHVDGYAGYNELSQQGVQLLACMAHVRRKFFQVAQSAKKKKGLARYAVDRIAELYRIEAQATEEGFTPEQRYAVRQQQAKPLLVAFKTWLDESKQKTPPKSPIGKAIQYALKQWPKVIRYLEDGRCNIDNNYTERTIKPFVIGRKNWLFADRPDGANAAANIFSLIETCKANGVEPYDYLRYLLTHLPMAKTLEQLETLLPYHCDAEHLTQVWLDDKRAILENLKQPDQA